MDDPSIKARQSLAQALNSKPQTREELELEYGKGNVWNQEEYWSEFLETFVMEPCVCVIRNSDNLAGSLMFQDSPRFYFNFTPNED